jgi:hypothetical protein
MIVLSYGMEKSGSTLAFELCKAILEQRGFVQRHLPDGVVLPGRRINFISQPNLVTLHLLNNEVAPSEVIVIKVHAPIGPAEIDFIEAAICRHEMKVIVNLRDLREICLSLVDAGENARKKSKPAFSNIMNLDDAIRIVNKQFNVCHRWAAIDGALHLLYDDVAFNSTLATAQICNHFDLPMLNDREIENVQSHLLNKAFTQLNKGKRKRYEEELTDAENASLLDRIEDSREFAKQICEQKNYGWFKRHADV